MIKNGSSVSAAATDADTSSVLAVRASDAGGAVCLPGCPAWQTTDRSLVRRWPSPPCTAGRPVGRCPSPRYMARGFLPPTETDAIYSSMRGAIISERGAEHVDRFSAHQSSSWLRRYVCDTGRPGRLPRRIDAYWQAFFVALLYTALPHSLRMARTPANAVQLSRHQRRRKPRRFIVNYGS